MTTPNENCEVFWNKEPPTSAGWWWHTFTVDPSDKAAVEVLDEGDGLYVVGARLERIPVEIYGGKHSRWWPGQLIPPRFPETNP